MRLILVETRKGKTYALLLKGRWLGGAARWLRGAISVAWRRGASRQDACGPRGGLRDLLWTNESATRKGSADSLAHGVRHRGIAAKAHFGFCRVHVDVYFFERRFQKQQSGRIDAMRQYRTVAFRQRAANQTIAHKPPVDEQVLRVAGGTPIARRRYIAAHTHDLWVSAIDFQKVLQKLFAKNLISPLA